MTEREIVQKIKDDGYNCNHTSVECQICPLSIINNDGVGCGKSLNDKATHEDHLKRIKLVDEYLNESFLEYIEKLEENFRTDKERIEAVFRNRVRIKPEPKYKPYTKPNYDLCGVVIKDKNKNHFLITAVSEDNKYFILGSFKTANQLFSCYVNKDDKPLGEEI